MSNKNQTKRMTIACAAGVAGVTEERIRQVMRAGRIRSEREKIGGQIRVLLFADDVYAYLADRERIRELSQVAA